MKKIFVFALLMSGCAATYKAPETIKQTFSQKYEISTSEVLNKSKQVLALDGFQIQSFDDADIISTSLKSQKLTPCPCAQEISHTEPHAKNLEFVVARGRL